MAFELSQRSIDRLKEVNPNLVKVVERAITLTEVDFAVTEGLRSRQRQAELVKAGASKTMNSKHLTGDAVDLAAVVGSEIRWDFALYYKIARAMQQAAKELGVELVWGAVWDTPLSEIGDPEKAVAAYVQRRKTLGKTAFLDAPHYQIKE